MVLAHVAVYNALNFFSRILIRSEALVYNSCFFSEQPFYGNYSTLGSHTNTVISHAVAYSSWWLPKPWQGLMNWIVTCEWILKQMVKEEFSRQFKNMMKYPPNLFKINLFKVWSWKGTQFAEIISLACVSNETHKLQLVYIGYIGMCCANGYVF